MWPCAGLVPRGAVNGPWCLNMLLFPVSGEKVRLKEILSKKQGNYSCSVFMFLPFPTCISLLYSDRSLLKPESPCTPPVDSTTVNDSPIRCPHDLALLPLPKPHALMSSHGPLTSSLCRDPEDPPAPLPGEGKWGTEVRASTWALLQATPSFW